MDDVTIALYRGLQSGRDVEKIDLTDEEKENISDRGELLNLLASGRLTTSDTAWVLRLLSRQNQWSRTTQRV